MFSNNINGTLKHYGMDKLKCQQKLLQKKKEENMVLPHNKHKMPMSKQCLETGAQSLRAGIVKRI